MHVGTIVSATELYLSQDVAIFLAVSILHVRITSTGAELAAMH